MPDDKALDIVLIGCGKMGAAMLHGWLEARIAGTVHVMDPAGLPDTLHDCLPNPVHHYESADALAAAKPVADFYILAVKPQIMATVCEDLAPAIASDTPVLSIAAGQSIGAFESYFSARQPVIRAMPNTPAAIGKGMTVAVANDHVSTTQKDAATRVLQAVGMVAWIEDESLMDAVTAVSGSGPAYVFYFIEALAKAGKKAGLDPAFAMTLARQTVIGSAALAETDADTAAATLRENVTSSGGTTAAALEILMNGEFQDIVDQAVAAATARGKALNQ